MPSAWCIARDQEAVSQRYTYLASCSLGRFDLQRAWSSQGLLDIWTELIFWTFPHEAWVWTKKPRITRAMDSRLKWGVTTEGLLLVVCIQDVLEGRIDDFTKALTKQGGPKVCWNAPKIWPFLFSHGFNTTNVDFEATSIFFSVWSIGTRLEWRAIF